jgi:hypothetical protein
MVNRNEQVTGLMLGVGLVPPVASTVNDPLGSSRVCRLLLAGSVGLDDRLLHEPAFCRVRVTKSLFCFLCGVGVTFP